MVNFIETDNHLGEKVMFNQQELATEATRIALAKELGITREDLGIRFQLKE